MSVLLTTDRNPSGYIPLEESYSPAFHRLTQAVRYRAVHLYEPVPPASEVITKYSKPPEELVEKSLNYLGRLRTTADVKKGNTSAICHSTLT